VRAGAAAIVIALLVLTSAVGSDDDFPFAPFRMYARATRPTGVVATPFLIGVNASGTHVEIRSAAFGLRPAELEGQYPRLQGHPELLGVLARAYEVSHPDVDLVELRLMRRRRHLVDSQVVRESSSVVVIWRQSDR
jgi:hypothetical protein